MSSAFTDPLPHALTAYAHTHPRVDVRVREVDTHVGIELLRRREIDIAVWRPATNRLVADFLEAIKQSAA